MKLLHAVKFLALIGATILLPTLAHTQKSYKGSFKDAMVVEFLAPFKQITIEAENEEVTLPLNDDSKFVNKKNKPLKPEQIVASAIIEVSYDLIGNQRVVTELKYDIDEDGTLKLEGLFEAVEKDIAFIDGHKVKLGDGLAIVGRKDTKCACKGLVAPSFTDQFIKPGQFFFELKGKWNDQGIIVAEEIEACRNTLLPADAKLRAAVEESYKAEGLHAIATPKNLPFQVGLPLHNGTITIGQYDYKLLDDIRIQGYINSVGERLIPDHQKALPAGDANKINFRFYVIDNPIPNAFAFPNGMIFVHTGILDIMENEAELAVVLGHEIAHVTHEHGRENYESTNLVGTLGNFGAQLLGRFTRNTGLAAGIASSITQVYSALRPEGLANIINPQPDRESQADRVGLQYAYMAGYDVREAVNFWNKMKRLTNDGNFKAKAGENFKLMLASSNFSYGNPLNTLGDVGLGVLAKMLLETAYTSHPKSKARAQALNQLILTGYKGEDLNGLDKGETLFKKYLRGK